jgi:hypothetical protein
MFTISGTVMTIIALQFWFVTKYWQVNAIESLLMATASLILTVYWLPESPRFLYS